jgi:hypothetical protein
MKKYLIFLFTLFCIFNLKAEGHHSNRISSPNYKNLKLYVKVLERYGKSDFYLAQIDIVNTGNSTVTFWEPTYGYSWIFVFSAAGVKFKNQDEHQYTNKKITYLQPIKGVNKKIKIFEHTTYKIKAEFYIHNRELFLKTNKNLRVVFLYNDANLGFMEDENRPKIISENTIDFKW